jgi:uncharacterized membrane protein YozB (DUF420 family)
VRVQFREGEQRLGLFNVHAPFLADLNLLLQVAVLLVLLASLRFKFRRSYLRHGVSMGLAVVLHTVSIFVVMVPSLLASGGLFGDLSNRLALAVLSHAVLGSFVEVLSLYLLSVLALNRGVTKACFRNKVTMRITLVLWVVELIVGVYVYFLLYTFG